MVQRPPCPRLDLWFVKSRGHSNGRVILQMGVRHQRTNIQPWLSRGCAVTDVPDRILQVGVFYAHYIKRLVSPPRCSQTASASIARPSTFPSLSRPQHCLVLYNAFRNVRHEGEDSQQVRGILAKDLPSSRFPEGIQLPTL